MPEYWKYPKNNITHWLFVHWKMSLSHFFYWNFSGSLFFYEQDSLNSWSELLHLLLSWLLHLSSLALKCKHLEQQTIWGGISSSLALGLALLALSLCSPGSIGSFSSPASAPYTTISPSDPTQSGGLSQCVGGIREWAADLVCKSFSHSVLHSNADLHLMLVRVHFFYLKPEQQLIFWRPTAARDAD